MISRSSFCIPESSVREPEPGAGEPRLFTGAGTGAELLKNYREPDPLNLN